MKYSLHWIQEHIDAALPPIDVLAREVTLRAFEVEEVIQKEDDTILEMKVLPDRSHDALCHQGMAREIAALCNLKRKERVVEEVERDETLPLVCVEIEDEQKCPRYIATLIKGVTIAPSPQWLKKKIEALGGRSINNIVDITNFVLFDIGQPLHAFDAKKVIGGITVRLAKKGETMTTLDHKELVFEGDELVIADDEGVLALAGIKGGKKAEVTTETTEIILECANFAPVITRKTSQKHHIKTDASKRFENGITSALAYRAERLATSLITQLCSGVSVSQAQDVYPVREEKVTVSVRAADVNRLVGLTLTDTDVVEVLKRLDLSFVSPSDDGGAFLVTIPEERLDLRIKEDLIEEIGRQVGYDKVNAVLPQLTKKGVPNKRVHYANLIRAFLIPRGYSEVFTYSFATKEGGDLEVLLPVGKDRPYIRKDLSQGIRQSLLLNVYNSPLIGITEVNIFEIGNVFPESGEHLRLALGVHVRSKQHAKTAKDEVMAVISDCFRSLGVETVPTIEFRDQAPEGVLKFAPVIAEVNIDQLIEKLPAPSSYEGVIRSEEKQVTRYQSLSPFPFIVRDIAIFVPDTVEEREVSDLLTHEAGELMVKITRFDRFQKEGESRVSYGFRLVFQSFERTLTDDEIAPIMEHIGTLCNGKSGWEVR